MNIQDLKEKSSETLITEAEKLGKGSGPAWGWIDCDDQRELRQIKKHQLKKFQY